MRTLLCVVALVGCSKSKEPAPTPAVSGSGSAVAVSADAAIEIDAADPVPPQMAEIEAILKAGASCKKLFGKLTHDCAEYGKIGTLANQAQGDVRVAAMCAAGLGDPDSTKRLLAAQCLWSMNAAGKTPVFGAVLDALEAEKDPAVRQEIAFAMSSAEGVTAGVTDRVLALVDTLLADLKANDKTAGYLFDSLFAQYFIGDAVKAPPHAQKRAIAELGRDGTEIQRAALRAVVVLDDKPAVCAALKAALAGKKGRQAVLEAMPRLGPACAADVPAAIETQLAIIKTGEANMSVVRDFDKTFDLGEDTRKKLVAAVKASRRLEDDDWGREQVDKTVKQLMAPREPK